MSCSHFLKKKDCKLDKKTQQRHTAALHIMGSGSALPTNEHFPSSQMLELRGKQFMIDCGEGTQIRLRQMQLKTNRLGHVFISHLHGDHCFGLIGMLTTFGMLNRTADLYLHAHKDLQRILTPQLDFFCRELPYKVIFQTIDPAQHTLIYEDRTIEVHTIPLHHRVPTCGFLFREKPRERHIIREMIDFYQIPIAYLHRIKKGEDYLTDSGETIPNVRLTTPPTPSVSYAYCSDTAYKEDIVPIIEGVDVLYHEATFAESEILRAQKTCHSTAIQAATIAQKANVKRLVVGHFSTRYRSKKRLLEEAKSVFEHTELAADRKTIYF